MSLFWVDRIKSGVVSIDIYVYDFFSVVEYASQVTYIRV